MPTKYDVFAKIIEKAPCKPKDLEFKVPVYVHIESLMKDEWVKKSENGILTPLSNKKTKEAFEIIKWSLKNNINPNLWFSDNLKKVLTVLVKKIPKINPRELSANSRNNTIVDFLVEYQFVLINKKSPKLGTLLNHKMFNFLADYYEQELKINEKYLSFEDVSKLVLKTKRREVNPFGLNIFEFLAGSAQLEGGTVTVGETVDILTKDVYPDKPAKDIQMVKNLNEAFEYVVEHLDEDLTIDHIKEVNRMCLFSLHRGAGEFKKSHNKIAGNSKFVTAHPKRIVSLLENFCIRFNSVKSREEALKELGFIHNELQHVHPFSDGNSRATRMIVNWFLMKFKFPILILKKGAFEKYMSLTKMSGTRRDNELRKFLLHVIYHEELVRR